MAAKQILERNKRRAGIREAGFWSIIGYLTLSAIMVAVGLISNSIAIVTDGINDLTEAIASVVVITGIYFAGRSPDKTHPYGYGRMEYISSTIIAVIILYVGITSTVASVKAIFNPAEPEYEPVTLSLVFIAFVGKLILGRYLEHKGNTYKSHALHASGAHAIKESAMSAATLIAAFVHMLTKFQIEPILASLIALSIAVEGVQMLKSCLRIMVGGNMDFGENHEIRYHITDYPEVLSCYNLLINDYGPGFRFASVNVEVNPDFTLLQSNELAYRIRLDIWENYQVYLMNIGVHASSARMDSDISHLRARVHEVVHRFPEVNHMNGFHAILADDPARHLIRGMSFNIQVRFNVPDRIEVYQKVYTAVEEEFPGFELMIMMDPEIGR